MLRLLLPEVPYSPVVSLRNGNMERRWSDWFRALVLRVNGAPFRVQTVSLSSQTATIAATAVPVAESPAGLYRLTYSLRITRAAGASSSATVQIGWTADTIWSVMESDAVTQNVVGWIQSGTFLARCDKDGPFTYAVAYASSGSPSMQFSFDLAVEAVPGVAT